MTVYERALHECPRCAQPLAVLVFGPCLRTHLDARRARFPLPDGFGLYRHAAWPTPFDREDFVQ